MTINITRADRELLYELDKDCRQSLNQLAKKLKSKKTVVAYKIKRLETLGIIRGYYSLIDSFLLGYDSYRVYFSFQNITSDKEKSMINYFVRDKSIYFIASIDGNYDLVVCKWVKQTEELYEFIKNFMQKYRACIKNHIIVPYKAILLDSKYLSEANKNREQWKLSEGKKIDFDNTDMRILKEISYNAKSPLMNISKKLNLNPSTIKYRIKKLKQAGIIKAFRVDINSNLLENKWFKVDITLSNYSNYSNILEFIQANPNLFVLDFSVGLADIEAEFYYKDTEELLKFLDELKQKFPQAIRNNVYFTFRKIHKINFAP